MSARRSAAAWLAMLAACSAAPTSPAAPPVGRAVDSTGQATEEVFEPIDPPVFAEEPLPPQWAELVASDEPWTRQRNPPRSYAAVQPARDLVPEITWPDSIDVATRDRAVQLAAALDPSGGRAHIQSKQTLRELGYPALFAIVGRLRELDYKDTEQALFGFELNQLLEQLTCGLNARYATVEWGEKIDPAKAQWNAKTVMAWAQVIEMWLDAAAFEQAMAARRAKRDR